MHVSCRQTGTSTASRRHARRAGSGAQRARSWRSLPPGRVWTLHVAPCYRCDKLLCGMRGGCRVPSFKALGALEAVPSACAAGGVSRQGGPGRCTSHPAASKVPVWPTSSGCLQFTQQICKACKRCTARAQLEESPTREGLDAARRTLLQV